MVRQRHCWLDLARACMFAVSACAVGLALGACKKPEYPACKKDKHCKVDEGEKCVDGVCQNCTTDEDCKGKGPAGEDFVCHEFRCADPATVAGTQDDGIGQPCTQTSECNPGLTCKAGKCDKCTEDLDCAPGTCDTATGLCSTGGAGTCQTDDDCAMDEICDAGSCVFSGVGEGEGGNPCELDAVYFDFDQPKLKPETTASLEAAAECIKSQGRLVYLEAHADSRGTEEYNIMLTDKRGNNVKQFLVDLGVPGENMQVISKGNLEAQGADEASMAKDRRVQFIWP